MEQQTNNGFSPAFSSFLFSSYVPDGFSALFHQFSFDYSVPPVMFSFALLQISPIIDRLLLVVKDFLLCEMF